MRERYYILYDGRGIGDPEAAVVLCSASSLDEARYDAQHWPDGACYSYPAEEGDPEGERLEFVWRNGTILDADDSRIARMSALYRRLVAARESGEDTEDILRTVEQLERVWRSDEASH